MALVKNGAVVEDCWVALDDDAKIPSDTPVIVSLDRWRRDREILVGRNGSLGLRLPSDAPLDEVASALDRFALIVLEFPSFTDGRPYSTARLLRERHNFTGEIRAVGNVLRDQAAFMVRCGFDAFELAPDAVADWPRALAEINVQYQPAADGRGRSQET